jgi:hypothetical protein
LFIGLNPSTADATKDDPTIRRCLGFARSWGFGQLIVANLFAYRSTDPSVLKSVSDPIGPRNNRWLKTLSDEAALTIAAWGMHGTLHRRGELLLPSLKNAHHLGRTRDGHPRHPLYLSRKAVPIPF